MLFSRAVRDINKIYRYFYLQQKFFFYLNFGQNITKLIQRVTKQFKINLLNYSSIKYTTVLNFTYSI